MNNKKKQILYNAVMIVAIVIMVLCAVFTTKKIKSSENEKNRADNATVTDTVSSVYEDNISADDEEPATEKNTVENTVTEAVSGETVTEAAQMTCTVQINCSSILDNMDKLKEGKADYVPASGTVLGMVTVTFTEGETAFDILKRVCSSYGIQLEYSYTPVYGSYYVEGINNLYELDCGSGSGWHYYINGSSPGYGCSSYNMMDGDSMVWNYYCQ